MINLSPFSSMMRYTIVANPLSGKMSVDQKSSVLSDAADILDADIVGLDTKSEEELTRCALEKVDHCDVIVVAGGDGTFSQMINAIDASRTVFAYLPLGTGNALRHALYDRGRLVHMAARIMEGSIQSYDLIDCDGKKRAFMASVGFEGTLIRLRDRYLAQGATGFNAYFRAALRAYFKAYRPTFVKVSFDDETFVMKKLLSLMIMKQPYYGFGFKVVPEAKFDDGKLHMLCVKSGMINLIYGAVTSFTIGNRVGKYRIVQSVNLSVDHSMILQLDGNDAWDGDAFQFKVLPKAFKIKY